MTRDYHAIVYFRSSDRVKRVTPKRKRFVQPKMSVITDDPLLRAGAIGGAGGAMAPPLFGLLKRESEFDDDLHCSSQNPCYSALSQVLLLGFAMGVGYTNLVLMKSL